MAISLHLIDGMVRSGFDSADSLSGIFALVVDSEKERRALVGSILKYCGALVAPAETAEAALAVMELLKPDVIIVEFSSLDDGGLTFIRALRALEPEEGGMVATVAIADDRSNADLARSRGFDAYVIKPLEPWELCRVVASVLRV